MRVKGKRVMAAMIHRCCRMADIQQDRKKNMVGCLEKCVSLIHHSKGRHSCVRCIDVNPFNGMLVSEIVHCFWLISYISRVRRTDWAGMHKLELDEKKA